MQQLIKTQAKWKISNLFNPLLHIGHYSVRMAKNFNFKMRRDNKKISYERRVYESVFDNSLSYAISQKPIKKRTHATKG